MKEIHIKIYEDTYHEIWDQFIDQSVNGTLFHKRKFLDYHHPEKFVDQSLLLFREGKLAGIFPAAVIREADRYILKSHPGASYGGLVVDSSPGIGYANEMVKKLINHASAIGCHTIEFRLAPKIYNSYFCDELDFAFLFNGFSIVYSELSTYYDMNRIGTARLTEDNILKTFRSSCRRSTKKAMKSRLECRVCQNDEKLIDYWYILYENLKKHNVSPTHTKEELLDLKSRFPDDVYLIGVFDGNKIIAGIITFICNRIAAHVFYFASLHKYQKMRPLNLAILKLIRFAASRNLNYINFGISTEMGGRKINWGLFRFKEKFGGSGVLRTYWRRDMKEHHPE
jgi:lipid II:glycine glycyltransferase (peptidoglycan interpeptide bridge formation enzyme)